jgi:hypothetical protein
MVMRRRRSPRHGAGTWFGPPLGNAGGRRFLRVEQYRKRRRGMKPAQLAFVAALRTAGRTWVQIAEAFAWQFGVNHLVALRLARGWSQRDAAEQWNSRWPEDLKTFKSFSYWENWPASTGYAPSLMVLARLAELYECAVSDLVADHPNFRSLDQAGPAEPLPDGSQQMVTRAPSSVRALGQGLW